MDAPLVNPAAARPPYRWIPLRRPRLFRIGLPVLAAILIANQAAYRWQRAHPDPAERAGAVVVRVESGAGGHSAIGVDESTAAGALTFAQLGTWACDPAAPPPPCPPPVQAHHGRQAELVGFMYPLSADEQVRSFCLLRSTQTCCFGPRPQLNQYVLVETAAPVRFERLRPVRVSGLFRVDPQPRQGYIYRLEQATVGAAGGDLPVDDGRAFARTHGLAYLDWNALARIDPAGGSVPAGILALDGLPTVVEGHLLDPGSGPQPQILIGQAPPPGRPQGRTPTMTTAATLSPAPGVAAPEAWRDRIAWRGTLRLTADPAQWPDLGIVRLADAAPCQEQGPGVRIDSGPLLGLPLQLVLIVAFLVCTIGRPPA